jgi:hypothetical protein
VGDPRTSLRITHARSRLVASRNMVYTASGLRLVRSSYITNRSPLLFRRTSMLIV